MRILTEPRRPTRLIAVPPRHAWPGALAVSGFGLAALAGAVNTFMSQPAQYRVYAVILLLLAIPALLAGVSTLARRTRFVFDTVADTLVIERSGLLGTRRESHALNTLEALVLVRFWYFNRAARADRNHWYRLQVQTTTDERIEIAPRLSLAAATEAANAIAALIAVPVREQHGRAEGVVAGR